jgi:hypothetical protein
VGRIPAPSPAGAELRTAAYLLAACAPAGTRRRIARLALISALAGLARAVAELRQAKRRLLQATAANHATAGLTTAAAGDAAAKAPVVLTTADATGPPVTTRRAGGPGRAPCARIAHGTWTAADPLIRPGQVRAGPLHVHRIGLKPPLDLLQLGGQLRLGRALPGGRPVFRGRLKAGCVTSVLILVRASADYAIGIPSLPAYSQVRGLENQ